MLKFNTSCAVLAYLSSNLLNEVGLSLFRYFEVGLRVCDIVVKKLNVRYLICWWVLVPDGIAVERSDWEKKNAFVVLLFNLEDVAKRFFWLQKTYNDKWRSVCSYAGICHTRPSILISNDYKTVKKCCSDNVTTKRLSIHSIGLATFPVRK